MCKFVRREIDEEEIDVLWVEKDGPYKNRDISFDPCLVVWFLYVDDVLGILGL